MEVIARRIWYQLTGNWLRVNCGILWGTAWTIVKMSHGSNFCSKIFHPIAKEFEKKKFGLSHQPVDDFLRSQWQISQRSYFWLLYRWGLAICFCVGVLGSLIQLWFGGRWFIYLTDWGFFMCMTVCLFGAILVTINHFKPNRLDNYNKLFQFYWALHWSTLVVATVITFMYWLFIHPNDGSSAAELYNLWAHGFNSILMVLDHMVVAFPSRLMHFIYPMCIGLVYGIFSLIYYFAGGVDRFGNRFIYVVLDWSHPGKAILTSVGCCVLTMVFSLLLFCLFKLRRAIYRKCLDSKFSINA